LWQITLGREEDVVEDVEGEDEEVFGKDGAI
jgi:hypothetical protein